MGFRDWRVVKDDCRVLGGGGFTIQRFDGTPDFGDVGGVVQGGHKRAPFFGFGRADEGRDLVCEGGDVWVEGVTFS